MGSTIDAQIASLESSLLNEIEDLERKREEITGEIFHLRAVLRGIMGKSTTSDGTFKERYGTKRTEMKRLIYELGYDDGEFTQSAIRERSGIELSSADTSAYIKLMVDKGIIQLVRSERGNMKFYKLTHKGRERQ